MALSPELSPRDGWSPVSVNGRPGSWPLCLILTKVVHWAHSLGDLVPLAQVAGSVLLQVWRLDLQGMLSG